MLINWFTVIAQLINFLVLIWLLKKFLYKPILDAIEKREKLIAEKLQSAELKKAAAEKEEAIFHTMNLEFEQQKNEKWQQVLLEINTEKQQLIDAARASSHEMSVKLEEAFQEEQNDLKVSLARKTQQEVFEIARKALRELANENLEDRMVDLFIKHLKDPERSLPENWNSSSSANSLPIIIRSAFPLGKMQQEAIQETVDELAGHQNQFRFVIDPALISGIELNANGYRFAWSISEYLGSVEDIVSETMRGHLNK